LRYDVTDRSAAGGDLSRQLFKQCASLQVGEKGGVEKGWEYGEVEINLAELAQSLLGSHS
jgi:hypothetical protein